MTQNVVARNELYAILKSDLKHPSTCSAYCGICLVKMDTTNVLTKT